MAGGGVYKVIARNGDLLPVGNVLETLREELEMERFLALCEDPFLLTIVPIGQEIIQFD